MADEEGPGVVWAKPDFRHEAEQADKLWGFLLHMSSALI